MKQIIKLSVISAVLVTLISLMVYGTAQQMLRLGANNVPAQLVTETINRLNSGVSPRTVALPGNIEISKSLYPFVVILDQDKRVIVTSATLDGQIPSLPSGIFDYVAKNGQDRVTWQPYRGLRQALVVDKYKNGPVTGYVVAGQSLKETEKLIDMIGKDVFIGWLVINAFAVASIIFLEIFKKKK